MSKINITPKYDFQVGLGYDSALNLFGKGNQIANPNKINKKNKIKTGNNDPVF